VAYRGNSHENAYFDGHRARLVCAGGRTKNLAAASIEEQKDAVRRYCEGQPRDSYQQAVMALLLTLPLSAYQKRP